MTLPVYPNAISLSDVNTELGLSATAAISLNDAAVRLLARKFSGAISLADLHGKTKCAYGVWDSATKTSGITLSNGDLTVTGSGGVIANTFKTAGKWYWEITIDALDATPTQYIGVATAAWDYTIYYLGQNIQSLGWKQAGSVYYNNSTITSNNAYSASSYTTGDVLGFALDGTANTLTLYKNNTPQGEYNVDATVSAAGSFLFYNNIATANFGASAFVYTPPSGYNSGLYT